MQLSIGLPSFASESHAVPPDRFRRYARLADEYEFAGAYLIEHLCENPNYATSQHDPLTTLSVVAGETDTIPVGTSILVLPLRNPVLVAKRAATLQYLSGQRLTLGFGAGYVEAEFDAAGVPLEERSARYLEGIELIRRLFEEDRVTFDGDFYDVEDFHLNRTSASPREFWPGAAASTRTTDDASSGR
ncbi:LLM class flavin-dependent oxidoreductase [Halococcus salifodinae]|uniref:Coenzyme F420-dependent N5 N10-methylene tetrahydromethanopterin reductase n=1 Tax=Halococcus salifodinae DSM 8989 TaxID=1227456 RepID=M0N959_9EURY|nr:LLM class flavin-dependent oxidoreductase [Halococcus salifodinae]EMA54416.1 coenzyme F420-dependent N5 N10-methylene tetrahydromethanopterin reductase [Halococcus salifodinae DSM 8989]